MFGKIILLSLAFFASTIYAQTCLTMSGECVSGMFCPDGETCLNGACCTTDASQNCNNTMDVTFCTNNAAKCSDPTLGDAMKKQCAKTCKSCAQLNGNTTTTTAGPGSITTTASPANCVDKINPKTGVSDCQKDAYLCNNAQYYDLMTQQCPKTCGRCSGGTSSGTPGSSSCVDKINPSTGVSDCNKDAYLCNNAQYYDLMTQQCPKTCGRC